MGESCNAPISIVRFLINLSDLLCVYNIFMCLVVNKMNIIGLWPYMCLWGRCRVCVPN